MIHFGLLLQQYVKAIILDALACILWSVAVAFLVWFIWDVVLKHQIDFLATWRWCYIYALCAFVILQTLALFIEFISQRFMAKDLGIRAEELLDGIYKYKLHKEPGFKNWTRVEFREHYNNALLKEKEEKIAQKKTG